MDSSTTPPEFGSSAPVDSYPQSAATAASAISPANIDVMPGTAVRVEAVSTIMPLSAGPALPPGGVIYKVNSYRGSFAELSRDTNALLAPIAWITKLMHVRIPGSVNDPNVESLSPFEVSPDGLPSNVHQRMEPLWQELATLGFELREMICYSIHDLFNNSRSYTAAIPRPDGTAVARVQVRMEGSGVPPKTHAYTEFLSELPDHGFLWTTGAKSTLNTPREIQVQRDRGAPPAKLWEMHQHKLTDLQSKSRMVFGRYANRESAKELLNRHHVLVRDYHLQRRLFEPMSQADELNAAALETSHKQAQAGAFAYPEVFVEMQRLQNKKTSWTGAIVVLLISLIMFTAVGLRGSKGESSEFASWRFIAMLVPILLFHELGHYLAMLVFGYRNVRMFFIPFLGAAVSGQNYSAPGWKKVIVSLMGPLPGIFIGAALGICGLVLHQKLLNEIAMMTLILNGFNLLPVLPLDGGRVMQTLLFSRHYALDIGFRAIAGLALIAGAAGLGDRVLSVLGIVMLIGIPAAWKLGRIAADLKRQGLAPLPSGDGSICESAAAAIIERVRAAFPKGPGRNNKATAQNSLLIYESLCNRAPGMAATAGFLLLHAGSFVVAVVAAMVLLVAQPGAIQNFARAAAARPKQAISASQIAIVQGHAPRRSSQSRAPSTAPSGGMGATIANFASVSAATTAFDAISGQIAEGEQLERFGQTLFVSYPVGDLEARRHWVGDLDTRSKDVCFESPERPQVSFTITCNAPSFAAATAISDEASAYLGVPRMLHLIPPWSPAAGSLATAVHEQQLKARTTYRRLFEVNADYSKDPRFVDLSKLIAAADRLDDKPELTRLTQQQRNLYNDLRDAQLQKLRDSTDGSIDPIVVDNYMAVERADRAHEAVVQDQGLIDSPDSYANRMESPEYRAIAARMGQVELLQDQPAPGSERYSASFGSASHEGPLITFEWLGFVHTPDGATALIRWLDRQGCTDIRYRVRTGATPDELD